MKLKYIAVIKLDEDILKKLKTFFRKQKLAEHEHTEDYFYGYVNNNKVIIRISKYFKDFQKPIGYLIIRRKYSSTKKILRIDYLWGDFIAKKEVFNFFIKEVKDEKKENKEGNQGGGAAGIQIPSVFTKGDTGRNMDVVLWKHKIE
jgi:glycosyltransferase involved in cell wall biosynthesis